MVGGKAMECVACVWLHRLALCSVKFSCFHVLKYTDCSMKNKHFKLLVEVDVMHHLYKVGHLWLSDCSK